MSERCEPPEALRGQGGWHWLTTDNGHIRCVYWCPDRNGWMAGWGWSYLCPVPTPDQITEIARLRAALADIRDQHIGDQPAALNLPEVDWARRCHGHLRQMARAALAGSVTP